MYVAMKREHDPKRNTSTGEKICHMNQQRINRYTGLTPSVWHARERERSRLLPSYYPLASTTSRVTSTATSTTRNLALHR